MAVRTLFALIVPFLFSSVSWSDEIQNSPSLADQSPAVESETLRDRYLKTQLGFYQPEQRIATPAVPTCILKEEDIKEGRTSFALSPGGKLTPCIRETAIKDEVTSIPAEAIQKYLTTPRVVGKNELEKAPYVVEFAKEHLIGGIGDKLYVRSIEQPGNYAFTVYRTGDAYINPQTLEILGYEAKYIADATLVQSGDPATLEITKAKSEIRIGDRVMTNPNEDIVLNYIPKPPEESIKGYIIGVLDGVTQIGRYNVVVIDKGAADGLKPGHELAIYQQGRVANDPISPIKNDEVQLPDEISGTLMIFRPFERISYALVVQAHQAIHVLDKVQTP